MNREELLKLKKRLGLTLKSVKRTSRGSFVLRPDADPFLCGKSSQHEAAKWILPLWRKYREAQIAALGRFAQPYERGCHYYWVVKPDLPLMPNGKPYLNTKRCWYWLLDYCFGSAIHLDYLDPREITDLRHPIPNDAAEYLSSSELVESNSSIEEILQDKVDSLVDELIDRVVDASPFYAASAYYPYHVEVWIEKQGVGNLLLPLHREYRFTLQRLEGEASRRRALELCFERAVKSGKPVRVFYMSDFDPGGREMPVNAARKMEWAREKYCPEVEIKFKPIALTPEQVRQYKLPKKPIEKPDPRQDRFELLYGEGYTEIDSLEAIYPGELSRIVEGAIKPYIDEEALDLIWKENRRIEDSVRDLLESQLKPRLEGEIDYINLEGIADDLDLGSPVDRDFRPPEPKLIDGEDEGWLFDSNRSYWDQLREYRRYFE